MEGNRVADGADLVPYVDGLRAAARKLTSSDSEAEDLAQDCLASAVQGAGRVRKLELMGAWLHQILRRRWYDLLRRRDLERRRQAESRPAAAPADTDPSGGELVRRALEALDRDARRVLEMRFFQSRSSVEIARELRRPVGTVRSQLFHALRRFESEFRRLCPKETV
jgi:RNA polymerase sigma-70 factor (ECF subfamily)